MSSKIDGVPRELLERCIRANDEPQPSQLYADLHDLLMAPVVERQPVDAILLENCEEVTVQDYGRGYFATDDCVAQLYTAPPEPNIEAAAKKLAACMDYPWEHMPEQGRASMRGHATAVIGAALGSKQ